MRLWHLPSERKASAALEFALVALPAFLFLFGIIYVGTYFYYQQTLEYAVQEAARQVEIGQIGTGYSEADFVTKVVCPNFGTTCSNLFVDLHPVSDYTGLTGPGVPDAPDSTNATGLQFCVGSPGQMMYAHVIYQASFPTASLLGLNTTQSIVSNAAFINENPSGVPVPPQNGC